MPGSLLSCKPGGGEPSRTKNIKIVEKEKEDVEENPTSITGKQSNS
jgi:hypothetical protein